MSKKYSPLEYHVTKRPTCWLTQIEWLEIWYNKKKKKEQEKPDDNMSNIKQNNHINFTVSSKTVREGNESDGSNLDNMETTKRIHNTTRSICLIIKLGPVW